jgi:hypothetical protein
MVLLTALSAGAQGTSATGPQSLPRTAEGKPNLEGIWQASSSAAADLQSHVASLNMLAGMSVVAGGEIPYQPWATKKKAENFQNRQAADPLSKCYLPGVPRVMYLEFPFQILQTTKIVTMAFEWELDYRLIYTDGTPHPPDENFWMGDSRGHWEGGGFSQRRAPRSRTVSHDRPRHDRVRSVYRRSESFHQALEHQDRAAPSNGSRQAVRVRLRSGSPGDERRVHA